MTKIGLVIAIGLIMSLLNAIGRTFYDLSESNTVGGKEGSAADFMKDGRAVIFYETSDRKKR